MNIGPVDSKSADTGLSNKVPKWKWFLKYTRIHLPMYESITGKTEHALKLCSLWYIHTCSF